MSNISMDTLQKMESSESKKTLVSRKKHYKKIPLQASSTQTILINVFIGCKTFIISRKTFINIINKIHYHLKWGYSLQKLY